MCPDLICVLDSVNGHAVGTETVRYASASPWWRCLRRRCSPAPAPRIRRPAPSATTSNFVRCSPRRSRSLIDETHRHRRRRHQHGCRPARRRKNRPLGQAADHGDVTSGILDALKALRANPVRRYGRAVVIGTTHFINAVCSAAICKRSPPSASHAPAPRCRRSATGLRPRRSGQRRHLHARGGHDYDGRPFMPLDIAGLKARRAGSGQGLRSVAVCSSFSPLDLAANHRTGDSR